MNNKVSGIILAGGKSSRMGEDKSKLKWKNKTLIEHVIDTIRPVVDEVVVSVDDYRNRDIKDVQVVKDIIPNTHALGGIYSGLQAAKHDICFVCACDMPYINIELVKYLFAQAGDADVVIPKTKNGLEALHGVYHKRILGLMKRHIDQGVLAVHDLISKVHTRLVEPDEIIKIDPSGASFINLNTPEEYQNLSTSEKGV